MLKRGSGHIVAISSVQGKLALPHRSAYSASKHALQAFCDSLRAEVASKGIKVTCISPGYIHTKLSLNALTGDGNKYGKMDKTIEKGFAPEYVANEILNAVVSEKSDQVIAQFDARVGVYLRTLLPGLLFWILKKRADKEK